MRFTFISTFAVSVLAMTSMAIAAPSGETSGNTCNNGTEYCCQQVVKTKSGVFDYLAKYQSGLPITVIVGLLSDILNILDHSAVGAGVGLDCTILSGCQAQQTCCTGPVENSGITIIGSCNNIL